MTLLLKKFKEISDNYEAIFCDLWGCIHDGKKIFPEAAQSLAEFKKTGGKVILLTNAPRPSHEVSNQLRSLGLSDTLYDDIVTSGDATREQMFEGLAGEFIFHLGPEKDLSFFDSGTYDSQTKKQVSLVPLEKASGIVCTGLFNDLTETPENYSDLINFGVKQKLKLLCANPDMKVDFGRKRIWCAGGIAKKYSDAGGKTFYFGKPYSAIYEKAFQKLKLLKKNVERKNILCIGDGINTDIKGGIMNGFKTLFICGGLSNEELQVFPESPEPQQAILKRFLESYNLTPTAAIGYLQ